MSDTQRDREERQHVIEILQKEKRTALHDNKWAFDYAIASIETDLRYDLLYEETSGQADKPTTKNDLGVDKTFYEQIVEYCNEHFLVLVEKDVWEDARKALTTKNDLVVDAISRQAINGYIDYILSHGMGKKKSFDFIKKFVANLPPATPQEPKTGHCKNCKFFELNSWAACGGIPIIVAHEICKAWGEGCKTKEDGYCFLFEPRESEDKE